MNENEDILDMREYILNNMEVINLKSLYDLNEKVSTDPKIADYILAINKENSAMAEEIVLGFIKFFIEKAKEDSLVLKELKDSAKSILHYTSSTFSSFKQAETPVFKAQFMGLLLPYTQALIYMSQFLNKIIAEDVIAEDDELVKNTVEMIDLYNVMREEAIKLKEELDRGMDLDEDDED